MVADVNNASGVGDEVCVVTHSGAPVLDGVSPDDVKDVTLERIFLQRSIAPSPFNRSIGLFPHFPTIYFTSSQTERN